MKIKKQSGRGPVVGAGVLVSVCVCVWGGGFRLDVGGSGRM